MTEVTNTNAPESKQAGSKEEQHNKLEGSSNLDESGQSVEPAKNVSDDESQQQFQKTVAAAEKAFEDDSDPVDEEAADQLPIAVSYDGPKRVGLTILFLVFGVFGLWSVLAPLEGAALAPGQVAVKSYKKTVQHLEGGIVADIKVRNGDVVEAGDILLVMDNTQPLGQLEIIKGQYLALLAKEARLLAERDGLDAVNYADALYIDDKRAAAEISAQNQIFLARKNAREGSMSVLEQRVEQLQTQIEGLEALKATKQALVESYKEEVADFSDLLKEGFADKNRLRELERNYERLQGEAAELVAKISGTQIQIGETKLQILQEDKEFRTAVTDELAQTQTTLNDTVERMTVLENTVERTLVKAPVAGVVHSLNVHTNGGVISPGSPIAEIIPQTEELVIESRVSTIDIDRVHAGQEAKIKFSAFSNAVPAIEGKVLSISADSLVDEQTGVPYYLARVEVTAAGLKDLRDLELVPGMPAEVFIATGSRTLFQYMMQPIANSMARSMIED